MSGHGGPFPHPKLGATSFILVNNATFAGKVANTGTIGLCSVA